MFVLFVTEFSNCVIIIYQVCSKTGKLKLINLLSKQKHVVQTFDTFCGVAKYILYLNFNLKMNLIAHEKHANSITPGP